ncbi:MAG: hypothetical protein J7J28_01750, partial [Thaumarchaeota archaeon]|nr:hypothetical protein [Nitrososphaerota archaeon]
MRSRIILVILLLAALTGSLVYLGSIHSIPKRQPETAKANITHITSTSETSPPSPGQASEFLEVGEVYRRLGYPRISWNPRNPNYTVSYHYLGDHPIHYRLGYLKMPAIDLEKALEPAPRPGNKT